MSFEKSVYYGYLIKGHLNDAIQYVCQFPEAAELYSKFISLFENQQFLTYAVDDHLNKILTIYQQYYRNVFYCEVDAEKAAENLRNQFAVFFNIDDQLELCDIENTLIAEAFSSRGFQFLGGRTAGYYGPYIWKETERKTFHVELPDGIQEYSVQFLSGFLSRSWLDYLSFGEIGTGGWTDGDGIINCIKDSYDLQSENFTVSLLKHEAQHTMDLTVYPGMLSEDLEYRAKLVELIYSEKRNLLVQFIPEADDTQKRNGHACASHRIITEFEHKLGRNRDNFSSLSTEEIRSIAKDLFTASNNEMRIKYEITA